MKNSNICESFTPNSVYKQSIRWKRKPIWLPTGKTKMFRIPKRPVIPIEESIELKRLFNTYRTYMTSLRLYIQQMAKKYEVQLDERKLKQTEEEDFQACSAINDEWNASVAKIREVRLKAEKEAYKEKIFKIMMNKEEEQETLKKQANEQIRRVKEVADTFITAKNIDAAIEECLSNIVNHNRGIDLNGNWYDGKYPPTQVTEEVATQSTVNQ
ncbi:Probable 28S ribosomal protein S26, mitochondrial [Harpegnathos saltator]|uniref:Small ribosomal subunit protein mS26 n=2 Tax=Harpegnathos saltator TaxID=610380 RepID=E2B4K4_HARSA|nr:Probable 28S ribosomal protein S26, mitochondrial [Harpegnathos saltator]